MVKKSKPSFTLTGFGIMAWPVIALFCGLLYATFRSIDFLVWFAFGVHIPGWATFLLTILLSEMSPLIWVIAIVADVILQMGHHTQALFH